MKEKDDKEIYKEQVEFIGKILRGSFPGVVERLKEGKRPLKKDLQLAHALVTGILVSIEWLGYSANQYIHLMLLSGRVDDLFRVKKES